MQSASGDKRALSGYPDEVRVPLVYWKAPFSNMALYGLLSPPNEFPVVSDYPGEALESFWRT